MRKIFMKLNVDLLVSWTTMLLDQFQIYICFDGEPRLNWLKSSRMKADIDSNFLEQNKN